MNINLTIYKDDLHEIIQDYVERKYSVKVEAENIRIHDDNSEKIEYITIRVEASS